MTRTTRVLYVIDSLAPGGAETSLAEMVPGLIEHGIDLHVLPLGQRRDLAAKLEAGGVVVHPGASGVGRLSHVRIVTETARRVRPSLVHTTLFESDVAGRTAARFLGIPASSSIVNDAYGRSHYAESQPVKLSAARALDALTARSVHRFHAISSAIAERVGPRLGISQSKIEVIPRGRNTGALLFRPRGVAEATRESLGVPQDAPVILAVGRLEPQKGLHRLIEAVPAIAHCYPRLEVLIAGKEGRVSDELKSAASRTQVDIRFLGHRADVPSLLAATDVFCFPSEREGFGGVLLEAMAVGCPVVASAIPTSLEVLQGPGEPVGFLFEPDNVGHLAQGVLEILSDPTKGLQMAYRGRARFEDRYTSAVIDPQVAAFFHRAALRE